VNQEQRRRIEIALAYEFDDPAFLRTALTHRSHSHEQDRDERDDYERLEFLGDALLGFVVAEWLFTDDPVSPEGVLSRRRQSVVRAATLAKISQRLDLGQAIRLGHGEELSGGRLKPALLADLFEAVLGAVYLDGGIEPARAFVLRHLGPELREVRRQNRTVDDYKTRLQEELQARLQRTPRYRIVSTSGPAHALEFEVEVLMDDEVLARGTGKNRKQAEQVAARAAFDRLEEP
jgi:ribonuclease-3